MSVGNLQDGKICVFVYPKRIQRGLFEYAKMSKTHAIYRGWVGNLQELFLRGLMTFSRFVLSGIAALVMLSCGAYVWSSSPSSKEVFDFAMTVLIPLAALIIGADLGRLGSKKLS